MTDTTGVPVLHPSYFWSSDPHFLHRFVAVGKRGFATVDDHDQALIDRWNRRVQPHDIALILGDIGMGREEAVLERAGQLNGRKILFPGNHDRIHPMHRGALAPGRDTAWRRVFEGIHLAGQRNISGRRVMISHFPYAGDHSATDRYPQWRLRDEGEWLACGHVHAEWKQSGRQVNVGLDMWGLEPVPEVTLWRFINAAELAAHAPVAQSGRAIPS